MKMSSIEIMIVKFGLLIAVCLFILIFCLCSFYNTSSSRPIIYSVEARREIAENDERVREQRRYINRILSHYLDERLKRDEIIDSDDVIIIVDPSGKKQLGTKIEN